MMDRSFLSGYSSVWLGWVLASTIGWVIGFGIGFFLFDQIGSIVYIDGDELLAYVALPSIGISLGMLQWLVLRHQLPQAGWWILASLVGYLGALAVVRSPNVLIVTPESLLDDAAFFFILGVVVGIPQWLVLRRHYSKSFWWVLISTFGWMGFLLVVANPLSSLVEFIGFSGIIGAISGAVSGFFLIWLMNERSSEEIARRQSAG